MKVHICLFEPKKSAQKNGAIPLVIALESPSKKVAEAMAIGKLWESYPDAGDNFFNPKIVEDQPGSPRPAIGQFDEEFAQQNDFDGTTWTPKAAEPELPAGPVDLRMQPADVKIAAVAMYGTNEIDHSMLSLVVDFLNDDTPDESGMRDMINGLIKVPAVGAMSPEAIERLMAAIMAHFGDESPTEDGAFKFAEQWVANPRDRDSMTLSTSTSTSTNDNAGVPDYDTLEKHIALSIMGVHPAQAKAADVKNAKEIIAARDSAWRAWNMSFRVIVGILDVDTDTRHAIISEGLKNLKLVNDNPGRLEFVKQRLAGHPACSELANYGKQEKTEPEVHNLGAGRFSIEGLDQQQEKSVTPTPAPSNQGEKTEVAQQQSAGAVTDSDAEEAKRLLEKLGYSVYASKPEQKSELRQRAEKLVEQTDALARQVAADDFQQRAELVEKAITEQPKEVQENLHIWKRVQRTDPRYTKDLEGTGFSGTSINGNYMFMRATEIFGPVGTGWGVDILEDKMMPGAPMAEAVFENNKFVRNAILRDADGSILYEQNHSLKICFWYVADGQRREVTSYGATPYIYKTKRGIISDGEVMKKSMTDAMKKALSLLGFSADIFLGMFDLPEYRAENETEFAIKNASDKAEDVTRLREELDAKLSKVADTLRSAVTVNEVTKVHSSIAREAETHRKAAEAKGDTEHAKYLAGRLRRLTTLKDERIAELSKENA